MQFFDVHKNHIYSTSKSHKPILNKMVTFHKSFESIYETLGPEHFTPHSLVVFFYEDYSMRFMINGNFDNNHCFEIIHRIVTHPDNCIHLQISYLHGTTVVSDVFISDESNMHRYAIHAKIDEEELKITKIDPLKDSEKGLMTRIAFLVRSTEGQSTMDRYNEIYDSLGK